MQCRRRRSRPLVEEHAASGSAAKDQDASSTKHVTVVCPSTPPADCCWHTA